VFVYRFIIASVRRVRQAIANFAAIAGRRVFKTLALGAVTHDIDIGILGYR
jgi:hypothetical protein